MKKSQVSRKIVYLIRHGESEANAAPIFQAWDVKLTEKGKQQARLVAKRLRKEGIVPDVIYTTTSRRALDTAKNIASEFPQASFVKSDLFRELVEPQEILGKPYSHKPSMEMFMKWYGSLFDPEKSIDGTEGYKESVARARDALIYLEEQDYECAIVVTHSFFQRVLIATVLLGQKLDPTALRAIFESLKTANTGVSTMGLGEDKLGELRWSISRYNDDSHLRQNIDELKG